ncbi:MAG: T9SS type A sorting domain-containing protein [Bacteroidales bacterium]|nr:T9SS type A sorting domain-containing protein [Bacteroidales bacterium]MCF8327763.1 T9SS type A sorting domain-containing protein [Bacteroidales bacterium]
MKQAFTLTIFVIFLFGHSLSAQGDIQVFKTNNSSLTSNDIKSIDYDSQGNVWIGTVNGISVYNDGNWSTYTSSNSNLSNNDVQAIMVGPQGNVWAGTQGGASYYDGSSWSNLTTSNSGISSNSIRSLGYDDQGNIWLGTSGSGVDKYDGSTFTNYTSSDGLAHDFVQGISQDTSGNMWFGTSVGISRLSASGTWTTYDDSDGIPSGSLNLNTLTTDSSGHVWTGASKGLSVSAGGALHYDHSNWIVIKSQNSGLVYNEVLDVSVDKGNSIWFATEGGGVSYYNYIDSIWIDLKSTNGLPSNNCQAVGFDNKGNTWIGTDNGLAKYTPIRVTGINIKNNTCDTLNSMIEINQHSLRNDIYFSIDSGATFSSSNTFNGLQAGHYQVIITDSIAFVQTDTITIETIPVHEVDLVSDTTICHNENITLDAGGNFNSYSWNTGDTKQSITIDAADYNFGDHDFYVTVKDTNFCASTDTTTITIDDCTFIEENSFHISVSPNPAKDRISIQTGERIQEIRIFNISGKQKMVRKGIYSRNHQLDISSLNQSTYILQIVTDSGKQGHIKFIKS